MNFLIGQTDNKTQELFNRYEQHKLAIEASVALMDTSVHIPVHFDIFDEFTPMPTEHLSGNIGLFRVFFADEIDGIFAISNSWKRGCVMVKHYHNQYDEYIYVVRGKLKDRVTGEMITTPEMAQELQMSPINAAKLRENINGWYHIPAGNEHLLVALEDSDFVVKLVRQ